MIRPWRKGKPATRRKGSVRVESPFPAARLWCFGLLATAWFGLMGLRLADLQIRQGERYRARASNQQSGEMPIRATRGSIVDRHGVPLAVSTHAASIAVFPAQIDDLDRTVSVLSRILGVKERELRQRLERKVVGETGPSRPSPFVWVRRQVPESAEIAIREAITKKELHRPAIHIQQEDKRYYPGGEIAAQLLGVVNIDHVGQAGLELSRDGWLVGQAGKRAVMYDALKRPYAGRTLNQPVPGSTLVLTIDQRIQHAAEVELKKAIEENGASAGSAVVLDPRNGDVLAMANWPTFDANDPRKGPRPVERWKNRSISTVFEPGSVFKLVAFAAAFEEGVTHPNELLDCSLGQIHIGGRPIRDSKRHGVLTVSEAFAVSSNVGAIKLALRLGPEKFANYIRKFGFGERAFADAAQDAETGKERVFARLPGETRGIFHPVDKWSKRSIGAVTIGQEIGVTAVQLARATAAIANGGKLVEPKVVKEIVEPLANFGGRQEIEGQEQVRILSEPTSATLRAFMERTVREGSGRLAYVPGYRVGGKTGTAQKPMENARGYYPDRYIATFVGFAPVNDARLAMAVVVDSPSKGKYYGGQVAAPVFSALASQTLRMLDIAPSVSLDDQPQPLSADEWFADMAEETVSDVPLEPAREYADDLAFAAYVPIDGRPSAVSGKPWAEDAEAPKAAVLRVSDRFVPDMQGLTLREVLARATALNLQVDFRGLGVVQKQSPAPGMPVPVGGVLTVEMGDSAPRIGMEMARAGADAGGEL